MFIWGSYEFVAHKIQNSILSNRTNVCLQGACEIWFCPNWFKCLWCFLLRAACKVSANNPTDNSMFPQIFYPPLLGVRSPTPPPLEYLPWICDALATILLVSCRKLWVSKANFYAYSAVYFLITECSILQIEGSQ